MLKLLTYLLENGIATSAKICPPLEQNARGLPYVTQSPCIGEACNACASACPTDAIEINDSSPEASVKLDLGSCIGCGLCTDICTTGTLIENLSTQTARTSREDLIMTNTAKREPIAGNEPQVLENGARVPRFFGRSIHARVVTTGCTACDLEIGASTNPVFDLDRFGVHIVASPRHADVLIATGPAGKGMQNALRRCYDAMTDPRRVIAMGTCAISGGVHKGGYTHANGLDKILPVDVYVPGCPPHPWSVIHGVLTARGTAPNSERLVKKKNKIQAEKVAQ